MKTCRQCNVEKELTNFTIRKNPRETGTVYYCSFCKECMVKRSTKYRVENRETFNKYQNEYKRRTYNKEKAHARWEKQYYKDVEKSRERQREYRKRKKALA